MSEKIVTDYWAKPIPDRRFDWSATYDDYEGGDGYSELGGPVGHGRTEGEAILDLTNNYPRDEEIVPYRTEFRPRDASSILSALALVAFLGVLLLLLP